MAIWLKQSTASQEVCLGPFVDSTDGKTAETGLTIANTDIVLWKMGATSTGTKNSGGGTHMAGGLYSAVFDATDTNTLGGLVALVNVAGALPVRHEFQVLPANIYDSVIAGSDLLDVSVTQIAGAAVSASTAQLGVNVVNAAGTAWGSGAITSGAFASGAITAASIATDAIGAAELAADAATEIANAVWALDATGQQTAGTFGKALGDPLTRTNSLMQSIPDAVAGATGGLFIAGTNAATTVTTALTTTFTGNVTGSVGSVTGAVGSVTGSVGGNVTGSVGSVATGGITAASIAADAIGASELAADAVTEIQNGLATAAALTTVDTVVDAIKAVTDLLPDAGALTSIAQESSLITADDVWDEVFEGSSTARQALRLFAAALLGKLSGAATTTIAVRDLADSKDRITATVDADGNRSAVTLDAS